MSNVDALILVIKINLVKKIVSDGHDITDNIETVNVYLKLHSRKTDSTLKFSELPIEIVPEIGFEDTVLLL